MSISPTTQPSPAPAPRRAGRVIAASVVTGVALAGVLAGGGTAFAVTSSHAKAAAPAHRSAEQVDATASRSMVQLGVEWSGYVAYKTARRRLADLYRSDGSSGDFELPRPKGQLVFEGVRHSISANALLPILKHVSFRIEPGEVLGVIGPSGSGKSTLCRIAVGALRADIGTVRLDGADIATWAPELLGPYLGYVAQEVDLLPGSVATGSDLRGGEFAVFDWGRCVGITSASRSRNLLAA